MLEIKAKLKIRRTTYALQVRDTLRLCEPARVLPMAQRYFLF